MEKGNKMNLKVLVFQRAVITGCIGGMFLSMILLIIHFLNIIELDPLAIFKLTFGEKSWISAWYIKVIFIAISSLFSILLAMIYYLFLKNIESSLAGGLFGIIIWSVIFVLLPYAFYQEDLLINHTVNTNIALFAAFLLYGLFVGYSISFDYKQLRKQS